MKFDCIAFVNKAGNTLLTRTSLISRERMRDEVKALEAVHEEKVYAIRSYVNNIGEEVCLEIVTPAALASSANMARVEFWRPKAKLPLCPTFVDGQHIRKEDYALAGILLTPEENAISAAYDYTENPFQRWNPDLREGKSPSPYVGDVFVMTSPANPSPVAFVTAGVGFSPVNFVD